MDHVGYLLCATKKECMNEKLRKTNVSNCHCASRSAWAAAKSYHNIVCVDASFELCIHCVSIIAKARTNHLERLHPVSGKSTNNNSNMIARLLIQGIPRNTQAGPTTKSMYQHTHAVNAHLHHDSLVSLKLHKDHISSCCVYNLMGLFCYLSPVYLSFMMETSGSCLFPNRHDHG